MGHALMDNRHCLVVDTMVTQATGTAERDAAIAMIAGAESNQRVTLGADKGYYRKDFVADCRTLNVTPHVARNTSGRTSAIDGRTTRHVGYKVSLRKRKLVEKFLAG